MDRNSVITCFRLDLTVTAAVVGLDVKRVWDNMHPGPRSNIIIDTGDGDDALAAFVAKMAELEVIGEPNARASYSQAGYSLLGRVLESVTTYEQAIASLVFEPLGLSNSFFGTADVMTRRFAVGHYADEDGNLVVAGEAIWATASASAGSCARWTAYGRSRTAVRPTANSPSC
ncbi:serine hydrolase [Streptomyces sp. NPDC048258]|uniref:serine hydrolase n=1 Tax=Streptomyces sp. NPDC048258 TaxID=3365527 RepID=UPI0037213578